MVLLRGAEADRSLLMHDPILDPLDDEQRRAVVAPSPLVIVAPAGSGKTRVLAHRIAYQMTAGSARATQSVAISFTRAAAWELHRRIRGLGDALVPRTGTFHSLALGLLKETYPLLGWRLPTLVTDQDALLRDALPRLGPRQRTLVGAEIDRLRARGLGHESAARDPTCIRARDPDLVIHAFRALTTYKRSRGLADFSDLIRLATQLFELSHPAVHRARLGARDVFIDEFQDTNPAQFAFIRAWMGDNLAGLTVVGDPDQSIYGWNGADATIMRSLATLVPGVQRIDLARNYRARQALVEAANVVRPSRIPMRATRQGGAAPMLVGTSSEDEEAAVGAARIRELATLRVPYASMAVLARTVKQLAPISEALDRLGIPHGESGRTVLASNPAVQGVLKEALADRLGISETCDLIEERLGTDERNRRGLSVLAGVANELRRQDLAADAAILRDLVRELQVPGLDAVTVTTFHRAKGLQWHHVHLLGLGERSFPDRRQPFPDEEEERRLLYVAMTRATDSLMITWSAPSRGPTAWLTDVVEPSPLVATQPARAGHVSLHDALVTWRRDVARARQVPADQVLSDHDLRRLARHPVSDASQLRTMLTMSLARWSDELASSLLEVITAQAPR